MSIRIIGGILLAIVVYLVLFVFLHDILHEAASTAKALATDGLIFLILLLEAPMITELHNFGKRQLGPRAQTKTARVILSMQVHAIKDGLFLGLLSPESRRRLVAVLEAELG